MISPRKCGTMLAVRDGYIECPYCRAGKLQRVLPETQAKQLQIYCRKCKHEMIVDIYMGQCFMSRSR